MVLLCNVYLYICMYIIGERERAKISRFNIYLSSTAPGAPCIKSVLHMRRAAVKYTMLTSRKSCKAKVVCHARALARLRHSTKHSQCCVHISVTDNSRHFTERTTSVLAAEFTSAPSVGVTRLTGVSILLPRQLRHTT